MTNETLKIVEGDICFDENGLLELTEGAETSAQNISMTLKAWKGDCELAPEHGTDYSKIVGGEQDEEEAEEVIREAIFQEDTVIGLTEISITQSDNRDLQIKFSGQLSDGTAVSMEVATKE